MFLFLYLFAVSGFIYLLSLSLTNKNKDISVIVGLMVLLTPAQIEVGSSDYAPALITFLFNIIFEQDYSLRVLRPMVISISLGFIIGLIGKKVRKRFF